MAIERTGAGASGASLAETRSSNTTSMRRSRSVSAASGVTWPPRDSTTLSPYGSRRASASVMMSNLRPTTVLLTADDIQQRVAEMAADLRRDFPDGLHLVAV